MHNGKNSKQVCSWYVILPLPLKQHFLSSRLHWLFHLLQLLPNMVLVHVHNIETGLTFLDYFCTTFLSESIRIHHIKTTTMPCLPVSQHSKACCKLSFFLQASSSVLKTPKLERILFAPHQSLWPTAIRFLSYL